VDARKLHICCDRFFILGARTDERRRRVDKVRGGDDDVATTIAEAKIERLAEPRSTSQR
jgi:streptomycin 6-kinase